ncbi:asparagine synthase (glutamine-hydrolyzing) [Aliarcobacter butzleri]
MGYFTLGHNRFSIVDYNELSTQPIISECKRYTIVFNSEVYDHKEIREKLKAKYNFKTLSDIEAILYTYIEYRENCVDLFRGMFSFAIYDSLEDKLFCARDRIGIKPFVYYFKDDKFIFASEINVILEALEKTPEINDTAIWQYMKYLNISYPDTIFKDLMKLAPAYTLIYEKGKIEIKKYWDVENYINLNSNFKEEETPEKIDKLFEKSIEIMIADVELGSFLSGGIDSSLILYNMQKNSKKNINTYTLAFKNAEKYDETSDAKIMAKLYNTSHKKIIIEPKIVELLPKMAKHFGEPFSSPTSLLIHELIKETKRLATVALAGDGGDKIFGGYPKYQAIKFAEKFSFIPKIVWKGINKIINYLQKAANGNFTKKVKNFFWIFRKRLCRNV